MAEIFDFYGRYYDLLYADKDYHSEVTYVADTLRKHGVAEGNLLEFGSGTGIHGRMLSSLGYKVHGIELSHEMIKKATQSKGFTCENGDIRAIRIPRKFNAVVSLFHVMSYQTTNLDVENVFKSAAQHLETGGLFIFDFWYSPAVYF